MRSMTLRGLFHELAARLTVVRGRPEGLHYNGSQCFGAHFVAAAALTLLASRTEAGTVFPKTLQLTRGATYSGVIAELDVGICSHRILTSQTAVGDWGDGAIARDVSASSATM